MASQYRYSRGSFRSSVITALGLTAIVSFLVWLFVRMMVFTHPYWITGVSAAIFFSFCSAAMIWRYMRNDVILAVRPDGLYDARHTSQAVPWDAIKDLRLLRAENEFQLDVFLWPATTDHQAIRKAYSPAARPAFSIDLAPLDAGVETIVEALSQHKQVTLERV
ncbi:MAG: hypothetical protein AAGF28_08600 [Pseudomonadota bacterium]